MNISVTRNQKYLRTIFLFLLFNELLNLKLRTNFNIERRRCLLWTVRALTFTLRRHGDLFAFFTALPRRSDQKIRIKYYLILRKLHRTRKMFLKIILRPCKINLVVKLFLIISNDISSTTWTSPPLWNKGYHACLSLSGPGFDPRSGQVSWLRFLGVFPHL